MLKQLQNMLFRFLNVSIDENNSIKNVDSKELLVILYGINLYFRENIGKIIGAIHFYVNNIVFTLETKLCLYKISIHNLLSLFFYVVYSFI